MKTYLEYIKENKSVLVKSQKDWNKVSDQTIELWCSDDQLTSLPSLPNSLKKLYCSHNPQLTSLPSLPTSLDFLSCSDDQLTSLPELPSNLKGLLCSSNQLTSLPSLPENLQILNCSSNQLISIPSLPINLKELNCHNNQLSSLPPLTNSLVKLYCFNNPLECLIPEKFYHQQHSIWLEKYLTKIQTYEFQKRLLEKDSNQIHELMKRNIINDKIRDEFKNLISSMEWGLI